jgi:hypothetical protein
MASPSATPSEFARIHIHPATSAASAAFKLSPSTLASNIITLVLKKFSSLPPGSIVIVATVEGGVVRFDPNDDDTTSVPIVAKGMPQVFNIVKQLLPDEPVLDSRDKVVKRLQEQWASIAPDPAHAGPMPTPSVKWFYKTEASNPLAIEGDISGDESDLEDTVPNADTLETVIDSNSVVPNDVENFTKFIERDIQITNPGSPSFASSKSASHPPTPPSTTMSSLSLSDPSTPPPADAATPVRSRRSTLIPASAAFILSAFLSHQSATAEVVFRRKWCILTDDKLWVVSRHAGRKNRSFAIPLVRSTIKELDAVRNIPFGFEVHTPRKCYVFRCADKTEQSTWLRTMARRIEVSSENNFIELAEIIVTEEETSRANRCNTAIKTIVDSCGVPSLGGEAWSSTGKGAEVVELVRFVMAVQKYKETVRCNSTLSGPSWVIRIGVGRQWEEANEVLLEFWGDTYGVGDIFGVYENDELNKLKTEIADGVKLGMEKVLKGVKVAAPSIELFDGVVDLLHKGAKEAEQSRPRVSTSMSGRNMSYSTLHRSSNTGSASGLLHKAKSRSSTFGIATRTASMVKARSKSMLISAKQGSMLGSTKNLLGGTVTKGSVGSDDSGSSIG